MKLFIFLISTTLVVTNVFALENDSIFENYKKEFCPQIYKFNESLKQNCMNSSSFSTLEKSANEAAEKCVNKRSPKPGTKEVIEATTDCNFEHGVYQITWSGKAYFSGAKSACSEKTSGKQAPSSGAR
ncbi:MAG: hypothetical protein IPM97_12460 [Bdellovibrionaceae bacterium]|nr:hypothetical protein [Pseudobdellovibrionaceae bacterium]